LKARWEAAGGKVDEYRKSIRDMKVQLDAMSGAKCANAEHKEMCELRAMQKKLDPQYSVMAGAGSPIAGDKCAEIRVGRSGETSQYARRGLLARNRAVEISVGVFRG
jgi:hypothetical protein